ncbi:MAG: gamma-glutamyl-gamma-aminobutyrate hydrolase family protein [Actinomycetia bacterium]|nr:gamma-glutamyl-gamma-aminobutyrate hydrolase family protein [Actinomycetes bacterium]
MSRPLIAIPGRFSASASALRFRAVVNARKLLHAVYAAGGEPVTVYPHAPSGRLSVVEVAGRLAWADGLLLPGGGDLDPRRYGQDPASEHLYDIDEEQDAFDLAAAQWAASAGIPVLAICRGVQVVNTVRGGALDQHMAEPHRDVVQPVHATHPALVELIGDRTVDISCYHHQRIGRLGDRLEVAAVAADGTVEAVVDPHADGWFLGIQWHAEDTADEDPAQLALFRALVDQAARRAGLRPLS